MEKKGIVIDIKPIYITILTYDQKKYTILKKQKYEYGQYIIFNEKDIIKSKHIITISIILLIPLITSIAFINQISDTSKNKEHINAINSTNQTISSSPTVTTVKETEKKTSFSDTKTSPETKSNIESNKTPNSNDKNSISTLTPEKSIDKVTSNSTKTTVNPTSTSTPQTTVINWSKHSNVAEYGNADWNNFIKTVSNVSLKEAKEIGENNSNITYFFYVKRKVTLGNKGTFYPYQAVYFSGTPWYGSSSQTDSYEKNITLE